MSDEVHVEDLTRLNIKRVVGVDDDLYVLDGGGIIWRHDEPGWWVPLPSLDGTNPRKEPAAIDLYMHASRYNGHDSDIHEHHKFALRVLDHRGTLWELRQVHQIAGTQYIWDEVPL